MREITTEIDRVPSIVGITEGTENPQTRGAEGSPRMRGKSVDGEPGRHFLEGKRAAGRPWYNANRHAAADMLLEATPLDPERVALGTQRTGLLVIDPVHGFCTPGRGPLAPRTEDPHIRSMVVEIDRLARMIPTRFVVRDSHPEGQEEDPYPPHCVRGSGDDELVDELAWLEDAPDTKVVRKSCIDAVVATSGSAHDSNLLTWIRQNRLRRLVLVGICTDICVSGAVTSLLSARTKGFLGFAFEDLVVHEPGCATYDLTLETCRELGLPDRAAHPAAPFHVAALLAMRNQGAIVSDRIEI